MARGAVRPGPSPAAATGLPEGNKDRKDPQRRPAAKPVDRLEAVVPGWAHPVPGSARHNDQDRKHADGRHARSRGGLTRRPRPQPPARPRLRSPSRGAAAPRW